jgi:hypothetical protein
MFHVRHTTLTTALAESGRQVRALTIKTTTKKG